MNPRIFAACMGIMLAGIVTAVVASGTPEPAAAADQGAISHPSLVPEDPQREYPVIVFEDVIDASNRRPQSYAIDLIGNYIVSGGNFTQIQLQDGSVIDQPYLSIVDWRTKEQVCTDLDVDQDVFAISEGPRANTAFIAGRFNKVTGSDGKQRTRNKVALIDLSTCSVDRTFSAIGANGKITAVEFFGDRLFVGGDFTQIGGVNQTFVAELDPTSGAVRPNFNVNFTSGGLSSPIRAVEMTPNADRLVVAGRFGSVTDAFGTSVSQTVTTIINISGLTPTVTPHSFNYPHSEFGTRVYGSSLQAADLSPDGSSIALAFGTATVSDYVYLVPANEEATEALWSHYMRDSSFGIAISNNAVYVTGHFCKIDQGPGPALVLQPNSGPSTCTGATGFDGGVWRTQLAALSLSDGTPLNWNPGNNAFRGGTALTVVPRGLLVGFDGDRTNDVLTGTTAFFDFGPPPDPRDGQACQAVVNDDNSITVTWDEVAEIDTWSVRRNTQFLATVDGVTEFTDPAPKGTHTYRIRSTYNGEQLDTTCDPTVTTDGPAAQACQATLNPETGEVNIAWDDNGATSYSVRRNTKFVASASELTYVDVPPSGTHLYIIRTRIDGATVNTTCDPEIVTDGPPAQTCTATDFGDGQVQLQFSSVFGEDSYAIRRDGTFVGDTTSLSFTDVPGEGTYTYSVRSRLKGRTTNTTCAPTITIGNPPPPPEAYQTCLATRNDDGTVSLLWSAIAGETTYNIARSNVFLTTVDGAFTWTDTEAVEAATYRVRSAQAGVRTDTPCVEQPANGCFFVADGDRAHLAWTAFNNEDRSFEIRRNGSAVGSVDIGNTLVYTGDHQPGDTWDIYSAVKGVKATVACSEQ